METHCPICNERNACQIQNKDVNCWCMEISLTEKMVDKELQGLDKTRCLCKSCLMKLEHKNE